MKITINYEVTVKGKPTIIFNNYLAAWNYAYDHQNEVTKFEKVESKCFGLITKRIKIKDVNFNI